MFKAMRNVLIAVAFIAATANAQYKTPSPVPTTQPSAVQIAPNNNIQIATSSNPDEELSKARRISRTEAIRLVKEKKAVWVDVRGKDAYDQSHIPGAINIPLGELNEHLTSLPPRKFLITYCA
jgi:Rhodanese-like domain